MDLDFKYDANEKLSSISISNFKDLTENLGHEFCLGLRAALYGSNAPDDTQPWQMFPRAFDCDDMQSVFNCLIRIADAIEGRAK